jgi:large subunit ribosomal protein L30
MAVRGEGSKKTPQKAKPEAKASRTKPAEKRMLKIKLVRSLIGRPKKQREVVKGLGLRRVDSEVIRKDCPEIRGMINKIIHLLDVEILEK